MQDRLQEEALRPLMVHPLLLLVFVVEHLVNTEADMARSAYYEAVDRLPPSTFHQPDANVPKSEDTVQASQNAFHLQHEIAYLLLCLETLQASLKTLIAWSKDCASRSSERGDTEAMEAEAIIHHRWMNLLARVDETERLLRTTREYNEVQRQFVCHLPSSVASLNPDITS
jgi:hypothetical protein